jgi:Tfp pilus assembly protein PilE
MTIPKSNSTQTSPQTTKNTNRKTLGVIVIALLLACAVLALIVYNSSKPGKNQTSRQETTVEMQQADQSTESNLASQGNTEPGKSDQSSGGSNEQKPDQPTAPTVDVFPVIRGNP